MGCCLWGHTESDTTEASLPWEDPLEEDMATHSSILSWRIPKDRGARQATVHGVARVGHNLAIKSLPLICSTQSILKMFFFFL